MGLWDANTTSSVAGAVITSGANIYMNDQNNKANERMQQQQNAWNLEQWKRNNEYNSPANQMLRLKQAGLNPDLMYQQGTTGISSSPAQGSNPIPKQPFMLDPMMTSNLLTAKKQRENIEADTELKKADANQKDAQTKGINFDNITKEASALYYEEFIKSWNSYDVDKKKRMFNNILDTLDIQYSNALKSAQNDQYQNEYDYWQHMYDLYVLWGSIYGFDGLTIEDGGISATKDWLGRRERGEMADYIKKSVLGALKDGNIDFVEKNFEILSATLVGVNRDNAIKALNEDLLKIEKQIKDLELKYQQWYNNDDNILSFFGIDFSPREWQVIGPVIKEFVSQLDELTSDDLVIMDQPEKGKNGKQKGKKRGVKGKKGNKSFKLPKIYKGGTITL